jgi:hypothetical protein
MLYRVCFNNAQRFLSTSAVPPHYLEQQSFPITFMKQCYPRSVLSMRWESWVPAPSYNINLSNNCIQSHCRNNVIQGLCLQRAENLEYQRPPTTLIWAKIVSTTIFESMFSNVCINNTHIISSTSAVPPSYFEKNLYRKPLLKQCYPRSVLAMCRESCAQASSRHITLNKNCIQSHLRNSFILGLC